VNTVEVGQTWSMLARAASTRLVTFRIKAIAMRGITREAACVAGDGREFTVAVAHLKRGTRGARIVTNADGTPYVKPVRERKKRPWEAA
jgi:hypothetical protein